MGPRDRTRLMALAKRFLKAAHKHQAWCVRNGHRCGHSETPDSLGDEGWHTLHNSWGKYEAYQECAVELGKLVRTLEALTKK